MILPMSKQMKLMYIESCKQVAADTTGFKKGFRKKFRICNVFVLWAAAAMPTLYPYYLIHVLPCVNCLVLFFLFLFCTFVQSLTNKKIYIIINKGRY